MDAHAWDTRYAEKELVWSQRPNRFVEEELADLTPGRALDLAGGEGRNALWLASRGWQVELVEFSQVALDKAAARAERAGLALERTIADLTAAPALAPADLVVVAYLQLGPEASAQAMRTAAAAVSPGGTLLVVAHARRNLTEGAGGPQDPELLRTAGELRVDLVGTGLDVIRAEEVTRAVDTEDGPREAIDVVLRAVRPPSGGEPGA